MKLRRLSRLLRSGARCRVCQDVGMIMVVVDGWEGPQMRELACYACSPPGDLPRPWPST